MPATLYLDLPAEVDRTSQSVRPLHYWRSHVGKPSYGHGMYVTHNAQYQIVRYDDGWEIRKLFAPHLIHEQVEDSGILDVAFHRQRDAVTALAAILEAV